MINIFKRRPDVSYPTVPTSMPVWFTNLHSLWTRRTCKRNGEHIRTWWPSCDYCGTRFDGSNDHGGWAI